jgi:hypothetical protein
MKTKTISKVLILVSLIIVGQVSSATPLYLDCMMNGNISSSSNKSDGSLPEEKVSLRIEDLKKEIKINAKSENYLISIGFKKDKLTISNDNISIITLNNITQDIYKITKFKKIENIDEIQIFELNRVTGRLDYYENQDFGNKQFLTHSYSGSCLASKRQNRKF